MKQKCNVVSVIKSWNTQGKWFQKYILFAVLLKIQWIDANFRQDN